MTSETEDLLIHRALELQAADSDWEALEQIGRRDPAVWRRLALGLRDQGTLQLAMDESLTSADRIDAPPARRRRTLPLWSGWAAAALIAVCWFAGIVLEQSGTPSGPDATSPPTVMEHQPQVPEPGAAISPESLQLVSSEVVGELPSMMIETVPSSDGQSYEVLFLRRTLERIQVDGLYRPAEDEHGNVIPIPTEWTPQSISERM